MVLADHGVPFPCVRRGPYATQLDPWCGTLLWPDCTRSEELVQNFHLSVTFTDIRAGLGSHHLF